MLLTAVARNDRFCDGAWASLFDDGRAQQLLSRLYELERAVHDHRRAPGQTVVPAPPQRAGER
jgi:hypothetical protein